MVLLDFDDPSGYKSGKPLKVLLGIGGIAAVIAIASTLAANININSGPVEFGQGVAQTTACDDSITVTPRSSFVNTSNSESSATQSIPVGAVDGNAFIVLPQHRDLFYPGMQFSLTSDNDPSNEDLVVTEVVSFDMVSDIDSSTIYDSYDFIGGYTEFYQVEVDRDIFGFWTLATAYVGGSGFQFSGVNVSGIDSTEGKCLGKTFTLKAYGETETVALATYSVFVGDSGFSSTDGTIDSSNMGTTSSSFSLAFVSARIPANRVYKLTIESSDLPRIFLDGRTFNSSHLGFAVEEFVVETPTVLIPLCSSGTCSAEYQRLDYVDEVQNLQLTFTVNESNDPDLQWIVNIEYDNSPAGSFSGYVKFFNGIYGIFIATADQQGPIDAERQIPIIFSAGGSLPVDNPGDPAGGLTWSYPTESRYVEQLG